MKLPTITELPRPTQAPPLLSSLPIHVISIRPPRLLACLKRLDDWANRASVLIGTHGHDINVDQWIKTGKYRPNGRDVLTRGQLGCFDSHRRVWQKVLENDSDYAMVLEDDANLRPADHQQITAVIEHAFSELPNGFDFLYLARNPAIAEVKKRLSPTLVIPGKTWGLMAYILSKRAAYFLLHLSQTMRVAVDLFVSQQGLSKLRAYAIDPIPFVTVKVVSDTLSIK